jgi:hypothetical protein
MQTRRRFLATPLAGLAARALGQDSLDRQRLVRRHNPLLTEIDPRSPLSVGNGEFAFTADITGLQTFPEAFEQGIPLCTQSQWGWHSFPVPKGLNPNGLTLEGFETHGRMVGYATRAEGQQELFRWLRENPHRLHLGRIGFRFDRAAVTEPQQTLDLWTGILTSSFRLHGQPVTVRTCCHPDSDMLVVEVESRDEVTIVFEFPYGSPEPNAAIWNRPDAHQTTVLRRIPRRLELRRDLDADRYWVALGWEGDVNLAFDPPHHYALRGKGRFGFTCLFSPRSSGAPLPTVRSAMGASERGWSGFWQSGGAVDLDGSKDPRAKELERRIVLSQYLTAIQCAGSAPPQETGLTCNSWYGKFHLEMHWWHAAHFALWGREELLERSLPWYTRTIAAAREKARQQGYAGARWPKMTALDGRDSPSPIGPLLIWEQPHPIVYAELCYQRHPNRRTLDRYSEMVFETAEFMASYAFWEQDKKRYTLGPPVIPAQENHPPRETWNPTFELEYWSHALRLASEWRIRLELPPNDKWEQVRKGLAALPVKDGVYLAHENCPQTFTERNRDHPSMLAALGVLSGDRVDRETMRRTLNKVMKEWRWPDTWGWDFPMTAMTAARLGERETAIDALMMQTPKNEYLPNGHNYQRPGLPLYLPGNGGLLAAVAMMAGGWQGGPKTPAPGFPEGSWNVRAEGLYALL